MKQVVTDYFTFTKKERRGIFCLLLLLGMVGAFPYLVSYYKPMALEPTDSKLLDKIAALDSNRQSVKEQQSRKEFTFNKTPFLHRQNTKGWKKNYFPQATSLFYFDPNTLSVDGWQQLGVSEKTAVTIQNYLQKGGVFRNSEDIGKIYGLSDFMVEKLLPYVQIPDKKTDMSGTDFFARPYTKNEQLQKLEKDKANNPAFKKSIVNNYKIEINTADTSAWKKLPGIGNKLGTRIVNFRNKLGGFYRVEQVAETFGLPDSTFQQIRQYLVCNPEPIQKLNINAASIQHPYLPKYLANSILQYRLQHGNYKNAQELRKIAIMEEQLFEKILPYITVE